MHALMWAGWLVHGWRGEMLLHQFNKIFVLQIFF
jgi:hypothetical protein